MYIFTKGRCLHDENFRRYHPKVKQRNRSPSINTCTPLRRPSKIVCAKVVKFDVSYAID